VWAFLQAARWQRQLTCLLILQHLLHCNSSKPAWHYTNRITIAVSIANSTPLLLLAAD
jgi:hypothetical protein